MKVLITGSAGMIGANLAHYLIENEDVDVYGMDDFSGGYHENLHPEIKSYTINIVTSDIVDGIFNRIKPDVVYHLAAYAAEGLSPFIRSFNYTNNLVGTAKIINACIKHDVKRLVFTSSMAVYGRGEPPFTEETIPNPIDPYGVAKYACEMDIKIAQEQHGLEYCILRPHNVYGRMQNIWDKYRNVLGIWMYQHLNGQPLTVFGDGEQRRAFSHIDDIVRPLWLAGTSPASANQIINIGSEIDSSIKDAAQTLLSVIGSGSIRYLDARHEVQQAYCTSNKAIDLLEFSDTINLKQGLTDMWNWARKQPIRPQQSWDEYELDIGMYNYWK